VAATREIVQPAPQASAFVRGTGGKVWVEDAPGGGARFVVELPDLAPV